MKILHLTPSYSKILFGCHLLSLVVVSCRQSMSSFVASGCIADLGSRQLSPVVLDMVAGGPRCGRGLSWCGCGWSS